MKQEKKVNSYLRGVKIIVIAGLIGGVIGGVTGTLRYVLLSHGILLKGDWILTQIRSLLIPILSIIFCNDRASGRSLHAKTERDL